MKKIQILTIFEQREGGGGLSNFASLEEGLMRGGNFNKGGMLNI